MNFITGTRGGKLEEIAEAAKAGLIPDPTMTADLFDEPDIQRMNRSILGPIHRIKKCMSGLRRLSTNYMDVAPDAYMNKPLAKLMALGEHEEAVARGAPDEVVQRFEQFLADLKNLEDAAAAQGAPSLSGAQANTTVAQPNAMTMQGGAPMGAPPMGPGPQAPPMAAGVS